MIGLTLPPGDLDVLCLGAHPDDIEIGCGATLLTLSAARRVRARMALMTGTPVRVAEARAAAAAFLRCDEVRLDVLGLPDGRLPSHWDQVKDGLEAIAGQHRPDIVFCPRPDDAHQDHRLIADLVPTVWRDCLVLQYEIPKWDGDLGRATHYVPIADADAVLKTTLLSKHYPSQLGRDWWTDETFLALMRLRGVECRSRYAEAFTAPKVALDFSDRGPS